MTYARPNSREEAGPPPRTPTWITAARAESLEDAAFSSGAALGQLHLLLQRNEVPQTVLRARLALRAAEACVASSGRAERAGELRDAVAFLQLGDGPGPAGEVLLRWQRAIGRPVSVRALCRALPDVPAVQIGARLDVGQGTAVGRAAGVLEAVLIEAPRAEVTGLILAEAALAQALGWDHLVPLLAAGLRRADLRRRGDELRLACHRAAIRSCVEAAGLAADLSRRAAHLTAVAPRLRAKAAAAAVEMFLTRDAVAPSALPLPDRAARRLCDRLVDLGAVYELTGRDSFRLYGL